MSERERFAQERGEKLNIVQLSRVVLGLSWVYHGLFPKLLFLAPLELEMSGSIGLTESNTLLLIRFAGVSEIVFGILVLVCYRNVMVLYLNILGFIALLGFVLIMTPHLMVEAFNPVTTNAPLLVLTLLLLQEAKKRGVDSLK
ncbi:MAG: hypothetical protein COB20_14730 [SAR86 cluster bacterium]|uniref:DoxX family protein n=1 Tax=SAR86 cluster bacterium TaxID=2030880 RepID=A0A2A4WWV4_9GAMM|nr:MAG: hypothetical protein COB20_14730 [SAR86 cluster bacterium]